MFEKAHWIGLSANIEKSRYLKVCVTSKVTHTYLLSAGINFYAHLEKICSRDPHSITENVVLIYLLRAA